MTRIAFFGLPIAALLLMHDGHDVAFAALPRRALPGTRRLKRALGDRLRVMPKVDTKLEVAVRAAKPDLIVSWFWVTKLPRSIVTIAKKGAFGVHPSLLPRWRGPDPCFWAIDAGDVTSGVTAHRLADEYDTGAMLGRREVSIDRTWDAWQLARALDPPSLALLRELVGRVSRGETLTEETQDESLVTEAPAPDESMLALDWSRDASSIVRRVRAAAPYPGAWTFIGDEAVVITRAAVAPRPKGLQSGEATVVDGRAVVASSDLGVTLLAGRRITDEDEEIPQNDRDLAGLVAAARSPGSAISG